jgi:2Fe-2S ferredoxin
VRVQTSGPVVRVEPLGVDLAVREGETLMHAAQRLGYRWPTMCHGQAACTVCHIVLDGGDDAFEPPRPLERSGLALFTGQTFYDGKVLRLACQARPVTDTTVTKRGVRPRHQAGDDDRAR